MSFTFFQKSIAVFTVCLLIGSLLPIPASALGLSPPTVEVNGLLRDTTQMRSVGLYRSPDDIGDVYIHVQPDEDDVEFFVLEETDIVMLSGQTEISYEFGVTPANAPNGDYELRLRFLKTQDPVAPTSGNAVSIVTGVTAQILLTVGGEEILEYSLVSLYAQPTEEGLSTSVVYTVNNTGNVDWRPGKIVFAFFDTAGERVGEYTFEKDQIEPVRAGEENQTFTVNLPVELKRGAYTVTATFYEADEIVQTLTTTQSFDVFEPGTLAKSGTLKSLSLNKSVFSKGEKVKLSAVFQNDGEVDLDAILITEISRDGEILDLLRSKEYSVPFGEEFVFSELVDVDEEGTYELISYVEYSNRQTASEQISFVVEDSKEIIALGGVKIFSFLNSPLGIIGVALVVILITVLFMLDRRRKEKGKQQNLAPSVTVPVTRSDQVVTPETPQEAQPQAVNVPTSSSPLPSENASEPRESKPSKR